MTPQSEAWILIGFRVWGLGYTLPNKLKKHPVYYPKTPQYTSIYYSSFHFLFHYPNITPIGDIIGLRTVSQSGARFRCPGDCNRSMGGDSLLRGGVPVKDSRGVIPRNYYTLNPKP